MPELFNKYKITEKELEIIHFIRDGLISKKIADEMNLSVETISTYRKIKGLEKSWALPISIPACLFSLIITKC
jgi:FixJ family two-component response regulator